MTVPADQPLRADYDGNGVTKDFTVPFRFLADGDLRVIRTVKATGVETVLTLDSSGADGYTVDGAASPSGGTVSLVTAPVGAGATQEKVSILLEPSLEQQTDYISNDAFPAESHENALDRLTMIARSLSEKLQRTLTLPSSIPGSAATVPTPDPLKPLVWNAAGTALENGDPSITGDMLLRPQLEAGTDGLFTQAGAGSVARAVREKLRERPTALDKIPPPLHAGIAAATGTTNVAPYITSACSEHDDVVLPAGRYYATGQIDVPIGKRLRGAGKHKTILYVPATFNLSAQGVIKLAGGEPGPAVEDLSIIFVQPDTASRAALTQYPPAIYAQGCPRFAVRRVRIELAWNGIDLKGNSGGAVLDDVEISAFNIDIDIDGALDSVKLSKVHLWPFGLVSRPLLYTLYESSLHTGIKSGRCDDFHLSDSIIFSLATATNFYQSASGTTFGNICNVDFDDRGGLNVSAGALTVTGCYFSIGKTDSVVANISGGAVSFAGCTFGINAVANGGTAIVATGASTVVNITGGQYGGSTIDATAVSAASGARLNVCGTDWSRSATATFTKPTIVYNNASGTVVGNTSPAKTSGTGTFLQVQTDSDVFANNNSTPGWLNSFPAGALTKVRFGQYGVLGRGSATPTANGSGIATIAHGLPARPGHVIPVVRGSGAFVHVQFVSADDTNITVEFRDAAGAVVAGAVGVDWVAFL